MANSTDSTTRELQDLVTCALCLDHYQDPRLLPCSHTFCLNCMEKLVRNGKFDCPLRDNTSINQNDIKKLPVNRTAKDMVDYLLRMDVSSGKKALRLCDNCNENQAVKWCDKCTLHYCESCSISVHSIKALQSHIIVPLADKVQSLCADHPDEKFRYWCNQCVTLVCRDCLLFKHKDHSFLPIKDAATEAKTKFQEIIQETEAIKQNLTKLSEKTKEVADQQRRTTRTQKQDIEETFTNLQRQLEERKNTLIKQLEDQQLDTTNKLATQQTIIDQHLNLSIIQELYIKKMLESNDPLQILKFSSTLSQNHPDFTEQYTKIDEGYTTTNHMFGKNDKDLAQISENISKLGNINNQPHEIKREDFKTKSPILDISKPGGGARLTESHVNYGRGYKFTLSKPLKIRSIRVRSNHVGQITSFLINDAGVIVQNGTINSTSDTMKWLIIPLECEIQNHYTVLVWASSGTGSFSYRKGDDQLRAINRNCAVESRCVWTVTKSNVGSQMIAESNSYSIDMILDVRE